jgi:cytoskeletal protein RodZ
VSSINEKLKNKRLEINTPIEKIASELNIRKQYLIAIEEQDYTHTPGKVYAEGYIKLYATYLGVEYSVDESKATERTLQKIVKPQSLNKPFIESSTPSVSFLAISLIAMLFFSYAWSIYSKINDQSNNINSSISFYNLQDGQFLKSRYDIIINTSEATTDKKSLNYFLANYPFINEQEVIKRKKSSQNFASSKSQDANNLKDNENHYTEVEVENNISDQ